MFKKTLLAAFLFLMITGCTINEESENESESEDIHLIVQCDEQYNECAEKCGDPASEICITQCNTVSERCYTASQSKIEDDIDR